MNAQPDKRINGNASEWTNIESEEPTNEKQAKQITINETISK